MGYYERRTFLYFAVYEYLHYQIDKSLTARSTRKFKIVNSISQQFRRDGKEQEN